MGNRTIERAVARKLYDDFSKAWRRQKRLAGKYGEQGYRKPTFSQWYAMHQRDQEMMAKSTPQDVQEYLGLDPWDETVPPVATPEGMHAQAVDAVQDEEILRGVAEIPMMGEKID